MMIWCYSSAMSERPVNLVTLDFTLRYSKYSTLHTYLMEVWHNKFTVVPKILVRSAKIQIQHAMENCKNAPFCQQWSENAPTAALHGLNPLVNAVSVSKLNM